MNKLVIRQQQLIQAIFTETDAHDFDQQGLMVYRNNLRATATQALSITFPTVHALIGDELFTYAAQQLLDLHPPHHGDWAQWGDALPKVLSKIYALKEYPFVTDCARLDYVYHLLIRAADHQMDMNSLQLLNTHDPDEIKVELAPNLKLMESIYPLTDIRAAHKLPKTEQQAAFAAAIQTQSSEHTYYFICHRNGYDVVVRAVSGQEYQWYQLLATHSLGEALSLMDTSTFSFEKWLLSSIQSNVIRKFSLIILEE